MKSIVNTTSSDMATPLTKIMLGVGLWSSIHSTYSDLTVKLTSVIMVYVRVLNVRKHSAALPLQLLNNVVVGNRN